MTRTVVVYPFLFRAAMYNMNEIKVSALYCVHRKNNHFIAAAHTAHISANIKREYNITYITTTTTSVTVNVKQVKELSSRSHQGAHIKVLISSQQDVLNLALRI